jgi:hypothetical protein
VFRAWEPEKPENVHRYMRFYATPERIFMNSNARYRVFTGMDADAFLVRKLGVESPHGYRPP